MGGRGRARGPPIAERLHDAAAHESEAGGGRGRDRAQQRERGRRERELCVEPTFSNELRFLLCFKRRFQYPICPRSVGSNALSRAQVSVGISRTLIHTVTLVEPHQCSPTLKPPKRTKLLKIESGDAGVSASAAWSDSSPSSGRASPRPLPLAARRSRPAERSAARRPRPTTPIEPPARATPP